MNKYIRKFICINFTLVLMLSFIFGISTVDAKIICKSSIDTSINNLYSIASNGKVYLAVGELGVILISYDGKKWNKIKSANIDREAKYCSITWAKNKFILIDANGNILVSYDGIKWAKKNVNINAQLSKLIYINGKYITESDDSKLIVSTDGDRWNNFILKFYTTDNKKSKIFLDGGYMLIQDIVYFKNKYIAILKYNDSGDDKYFIGISADLKNWECKFQKSDVYSLSTNNNILIAAGKIIEITYDGSSWKKVVDCNEVFGKEYKGYCSQIKFLNNNFVAIGLRNDSSIEGNTEPNCIFCATSSDAYHWKLNLYECTLGISASITGVALNKNHLRFAVSWLDGYYTTASNIFDFTSNVISVKFDSTILKDSDNNLALCLGGRRKNWGFNTIIYSNENYLAVGDDAHILILK